MRKLTLFVILVFIIIGGAFAQEEPELPDPDVPVFEIPSIFAVDFDTIIQVPQAFRESITSYLERNSYLITDLRLTVSAMRQVDNWVEFVLVPTHIIEGGWSEVEINPLEIITLIAYQDDNGSISVFSENTQDFAAVAGYIPSNFLDLSQQYELYAAEAYLFPWTKDHSWYKTQGWHSGNALDVQPVNRNNPASDFAVLASKSGRLTETCNDGQQSVLKIEHGDGNTLYVHLAANSIRKDLLGQTVARGQFLGLLYNGNAGQSDNYQFKTNCGWGTAVHLHFVLPTQGISIDGHAASTVASAPFASIYKSSNTRIDNPATPGTPTLNNLISNYSFEAGGQKEYPNWSWINACSRYTYTTAEVPYFPAYDGNRFLATAQSADYPNCQSVYQDVFRTLNVGEKYTLALHLRSGHGPQTVSAALWATGSADHESATINANLTDQWQCFQTTLTVTKSTNNRLRPEVYLSNMGKDVHIDNVRLLPAEQNLCGSGTPAGETGHFSGETYTPLNIPLGHQLRVRFDIANNYPTAKTLDITPVAFPNDGEFNAVNYVLFDTTTQIKGVNLAAGNTLTLEGTSYPTFEWNQQVYESVCSAFDVQNTPFDVLLRLIIDEGFLVDLEKEAFDLADLIQYPDQVVAKLDALAPIVENMVFIVSLADSYAQTVDILEQAEMVAYDMDFTYRVNIDYKVDGFAAGASMPNKTVKVYVPRKNLELFTQGINTLIFAKSTLETWGSLLGFGINKALAVPYIIGGCMDISYSTTIERSPTVHNYVVPAMYTVQQLEQPQPWNSAESAEPLMPYLISMLYSQKQIHEQRLYRDDNLNLLANASELTSQQLIDAYSSAVSSSANLVNDVNQANAVLDMLETMANMDASGYDYSLLFDMIDQSRAYYQNLLDEQGQLLQYAGLMPIDFSLIGPGNLLENSYGNPIYLWPHVEGVQQYELYIAPASDIATSIFYGQVDPAANCNEFLCFLDVTDYSAYGWLSNGEYIVYISTGDDSWAEAYTFTLNASPPQMFTDVTIQRNHGHPTITWADHQDAAWFNIEINTEPLFSEWYLRTPAMCDGVTCSVTADINAVAGTYNVKIRSWNPGGLSRGGVDGWNGPYSFTLSATPPSLPANMSAVVDEAGRPVLSWDASSNTTWYQLWLGTDVSFETYATGWYSASYFGCELSARCWFTPDMELPNGDYVWYLQPWGPGGLIENDLLGFVEGGRFTVSH